MEEIARASDPIDSLSLGTEDFATDTGMEQSEATYHAWLIPRMQILFVARACGKQPFGPWLSAWPVSATTTALKKWPHFLISTAFLDPVASILKTWRS